MAGNKLMEAVESEHLKKENRPDFNVGDSVDVHVRIKEGDKERIQIFSGTVISRKGRGVNESFTVRRLVGSEGVERVFPLHSPVVAGLEVKKRGRVRRAKLYYLRDRVGKATKIAEKRSAFGEEEAVKPRQAGAKAIAKAAEKAKAAKEEEAGGAKK